MTTVKHVYLFYVFKINAPDMWDYSGWSNWNADIAESKLEGTLSRGAIFNWKSKGMNLTSIIQVLNYH